MVQNSKRLVIVFENFGQSRFRKTDGSNSMLFPLEYMCLNQI